VNLLSSFSILVGERFKPLVYVPTVVLAAMDDVHFLHPVLPDIGQPQIALTGSKQKRQGLRKP